MGTDAADVRNPLQRIAPMFDMNHPFFLPVWRRYATVAGCSLWALIEFLAGEPFWTVVAAGFAGLSIWSLLLRFDEEKVRAMAEAQKKP
jgi:hypothetical protein